MKNKVNVTYGALMGLVVGLLSSIVSALISNLNFNEFIFRGTILTIAGVWIGIMLFWLYNLLPRKESEPDHD